MLIGELSRRAGVHTHQLRYYEAQGLLRPRRSSTGYREYGEDALVVVAQIRKLLEAGLSTREIADLLPCATGLDADLKPCPELAALLEGRLRDLDQRIDTLSRSRMSLRRYLASVNAALTKTG